MTPEVPPQVPDLPKSAETVAVLEFATPAGTPAVEPTTRARTVLPDRRETPQSASPRTRQLAVRVAFFAVLLGCFGWGALKVYRIFQLKPSATTPRTSQHATAATGASSAAAATPEGEASDPELFDGDDDATWPGLRAQTLLRTHVRKVDLDREDDTVVQLGEVIAPRAVTVVNLWATWCGPCKAEFGGFQSLFTLNKRDRTWGAETRFVPILVDDPENARTAYRTWKSSMPPIHGALIDQGGVRDALAQVDKLAPGEDLPITLLFDCHRRIRWSKMSALDQAALNTLADEIDKLRAELREDTCRPRTPRHAVPALLQVEDPFATPATKPRSKPCNPRRTCDEGENCNNKCCRCRAGVKCLVPSESGIGVCPGGLD